MKRSQLFVFVLLVLAAVPAWAQGPTAAKAVTGMEDGVTTIAITVASKGDEVYGVNIKGAKLEDIRAPKGWVGISSGSSVMFRTGENPVKSGNSLAFKLMTTDPSATMTVSFRGKDDSVGQPVNL
ncbi:MAG TPA: hypothetical protein VEC56_06565 [Candidatus Krumholzibacteria bacterium]|nr:hypothetical protein [Candidatus Krumholzibacteria bacterium]